MQVLYEHRTQASCAEGEHIRGVVAAFRDLGHNVELVEPPGISVERVPSPNEAVPRPQGSATRRALSFLAAHLPEALFEVCELAYNLFETPRLLLQIKRKRPDLLYARYSLFTFAPALAANLCKVPLVLEINDATFITRSRPLALGSLARTIERFIFRRSTLCVTISRKFADMAARASRQDSSKILVLPNAISPERFAKVDARVPAEFCTLGVVGAFVTWHGLDFLIEAVARLYPRNQQIRVLLVGDGPIRPEIEHQVEELGLKDVVKFTGFVPPAQVPGFLSQMDICIIPDSNEHGSPMKLFEYMAAAKPILAPRYSPIEEVLEHGASGLLFEPRDLDDFCFHAERLVQSPAFSRALGIAARETALEKHTWKANVLKVLERLHFKGSNGFRLGAEEQATSATNE